MTCPRDAEIVETVLLGRWPDGANEGLRAHAAQCVECGEVAALAAALRQDQAAACREAAIPPAGTVWWRATIRARADAARTAAQPITLLQGIATATVLGLIAGLGGIVWRWLHWTTRAEDVIAYLRASTATADSSSAFVVQYGLPLFLTIAACLIVTPLAVYFATADD